MDKPLGNKIEQEQQQTMKNFWIILLIVASMIYLPFPVKASQSIDKKISKLESKVSRKFAKTFCNSTGFGISSDGALKFSLGETKSEFSKNPLIEKTNIENIKDQILVDIADTCYYFELTKSDLDGLTLPYKSK